MLNNEQLIVCDFDNQPIRIIPIFDVHIGASEFCEREFKAYIDKWAKEPNTYFVLGGDICNTGVRTSIGNPFDERMRPSHQKRYAVELLEPIKDRILCAVSGNHEQRSRKECDEDIMYDIMCKLGIEDRYREDFAFVVIRIKKNGIAGEDYHKNYTYAIGVTHGAGGGMYVGSSANRLERFGAVVENLDCLITGHTHKPITFPSAKLSIDTKKLVLSQKQFVAVVASAWLDWGGYSARKMLCPTARVEQEIILSNTAKEIKVVQK